MKIEEAKKILDDMRTWDCTFPNRIQTEAIDTVLNELDTIHHELKIAVKQIKDFEKGIDRLKKQKEEYFSECRKKDKVIDELVNTLKWSLNNGPGFIPSSICSCKGDIRNCKDKICEDCIKEYFYKKAQK